MNLAVPIEDFNIHSLNLVQRILVTTDGTLTETLAAMFLEPIELVKLEVTITQTPHPVPPLELAGGANVMQRRIVLRGSRSGTPYVYAEVVIATDQFTPLGDIQGPSARSATAGRRSRATSRCHRRRHADRADLSDLHGRAADLSGLGIFSGGVPAGCERWRLRHRLHRLLPSVPVTGP
jgi:chorismate-pyruvate lyase